MIPIPSSFAQHMGTWLGDDGRQWIGRLPQLVAHCAERWALEVEAPLPNLTFNYVAFATRADGTPAVLKIGPPQGDLPLEAEALQHFDGRGMVRLLETDLNRRCMLLERVEPGTPLLGVGDDEEATGVACSVMRRLWRPAPQRCRLPTVEGWSRWLDRHRERFGGGTGPLPVTLFERAERLYAELLPSMAAPVVLHGDLHHDNILRSRRDGWLAIDPKGVIGEPVYETGAWLRNWLPDLLLEPDPKAILRRRIDQFADGLEFDRQRIRDWGIAQAVLSGVWSVEDNGEWEGAIAVGEILSGIRL